MYPLLMTPGNQRVVETGVAGSSPRPHLVSRTPRPVDASISSRITQASSERVSELERQVSALAACVLGLVGQVTAAAAENDRVSGEIVHRATVAAEGSGVDANDVLVAFGSTVYPSVTARTAVVSLDCRAGSAEPAVSRPSARRPSLLGAGRREREQVGRLGI